MGQQEVKEEKQIALKPALPSIRKPQRDTKFAKKAADILLDIVSQNRWSIKLGGDKAHLVYEAWQTLGKYYGYTVITGDAEDIELGGVQGFKAKATVINEITGIEVGGAEAYCMRDEPNWKNKPVFQLASMAQTRAGAKALRQILGFVVALAGYSPTPAEEMISETQTRKETVSHKQTTIQEGKVVETPATPTPSSNKMRDAKIKWIKSLIEQGKVSVDKQPEDMSDTELTEAMNTYKKSIGK